MTHYLFTFSWSPSFIQQTYSLGWFIIIILIITQLRLSTPGRDGFSSQAWALMKKGKFVPWRIECRWQKNIVGNKRGKKRIFQKFVFLYKKHDFFFRLCSLLYFIYGIGIVFLGISGNPEQIQKGKDLKLDSLCNTEEVHLQPFMVTGSKKKRWEINVHL